MPLDFLTYIIVLPIISILLYKIGMTETERGKRLPSALLFSTFIWFSIWVGIFGAMTPDWSSSGLAGIGYKAITFLVTGIFFSAVLRTAYIAGSRFFKLESGIATISLGLLAGAAGCIGSLLLWIVLLNMFII